VADQYTQQDPTTQYPQPNFGEQRPGRKSARLKRWFGL
jgi:hypothetical protein